MKQGPYRGRRGRLHRHGGLAKRPSNQRPSRRVRLQRLVKEQAR